MMLQGFATYVNACGSAPSCGVSAEANVRA